MKPITSFFVREFGLTDGLIGSQFYPSKVKRSEFKVTIWKNIILNRGVYAVPANQKGEWRVGSTYTFTDKVEGITNLAREELMLKLNELVSFPFKTVGQEWGIRPTTHDRRPILGSHPEHKTLHILNGMGPKGVSLAPYFSGILVRRR